ncbi:ornithine cyclodeaminase family protein [Streptomyces goshikiensis]|uniref:Ornithine cyclodeaminase family protein n=3 Tax=Streptomyces TaxID=1883 RepID=A0ABZ1RQ17_9ACTN|nr:MULTISPECIES: ornithine cyclodeaminase family protein [Streptomyces]EDX24799.1 ornithine cyclodeaminase/mu-crystallin [Streptomyces sp. Mg1]WBY20591.1 ornithine cyclodeaminase family protein [Streptomyces goshikiensis]WSR99367.1 ornithine cyclodeaminase family protein [Streptomyces goshikiensis]WSX99610.1 ornithine cyclodeaminase family protein [Streptomyces goshikiensis]
MSGRPPAGPVMIEAADMAGPERLARVMDTLADVFADLSAGRTTSPPRTVVQHGPRRELLAGTAVWERHGVGSVKITTLTPDNAGRGLPLIHGVVVLTDLETGRITALLDGAELTAVRTGAVAGLATRLCAPADAEDLAVIGAGVQARALVRAVSAVRPIRTVRIYSRTPDRTERFAAWVRDTAGPRVAVTVCDTAKEAVVDAAVICTTTSTAESVPLVEAGWVARGAHVNAIGGTHEDAIEVDPALLASAFVLVEERATAIAEAGEVRAALAAALIGPDDLHELGALVTGASAAGGRTSVFRSVGMAIEDTAAAAALHEAAGAGG